MKIIYTATLIFFLSHSALASQYICNSTTGSDQALLVTSYETARAAIQWNGQRGESSRGTLVGIENAPYSSTKGFLIFSLTDFYRTADSEFRLAIPPERNSRTMNVVLYQDNDGRHDQEIKYTCHLSRH